MFVNILTDLRLLNIRCWRYRRSGSQIGKEAKTMDGVHYWRSHGHEWPSILRALAQTVFDALASVVVMERDSCIADTFIPRKHGGVDTTNLEMALYLRGQFNYIPKTFPSLATKRRRTPPRIDLKTCVKEVQVLGFNVSDEPKAVLKYLVVCLREFAIRCRFNTKYM